MLKVTGGHYLSSTLVMVCVIKSERICKEGNITPGRD